VDQADVQLIEAAIARHPDNPDWYAAQLAVARAYTESVAEAVELADAMHELEPVPPATTDDEEASAREALGAQMEEVFGKVGARGEEGKESAPVPPPPT
jgi:hypothetical protein